MKKLTLLETWRSCLSMWKWIDAEVEKKGIDYWKENDLKTKWLFKQRITWHVRYDCFFCDYAERHGGLHDIKIKKSCVCSACPGRLVSKRFNCEDYKSYDWAGNPRAFYKKLLELNKKRLEKK